MKAQHSTQNADRSVESPKGSYDVKRRDAFLAANWPERVAIHDGIAARKTGAMEARRELGRRYLECHSESCVVSWE